MEPLEAGGTHAASGRGSTLGCNHLGSHESRLCREAVTSQPCSDFGQAEVLERQSHVESWWARVSLVFPSLSPLAPIPSHPPHPSRICLLLFGLVPAGRGAEICVLESQPEGPGKSTLKVNQPLPLPHPGISLNSHPPTSYPNISLRESDWPFFFDNLQWCHAWQKKKNPNKQTKIMPLSKEQFELFTGLIPRSLRDPVNRGLAGVIYCVMGAILYCIVS